MNVKKLLINFFTLSVRLNMPGVAAYILFILSKPITHDQRSYRVLFLSKPIFNDDVAAIARFGKEIEFVQFPRRLLYDVYKVFIPEYAKLAPDNYHSVIETLAGKEKLRKFFKDMVPVLSKRLKFDAVVSGNFVYISQQEFLKECRANNIPVVILYKEGMVTQDTFDKMIETYYKQNRFTGDKLLCYNENIRNAMVEGRIPGLTPEKARTVGIPRFDTYYKEKVQSVGKTVVLFSFYQREKLKHVITDEKTMQAIERRTKEFHLFLIKFAMNNPDYQVTIKTKAATHYLEYVHAIVKETSPDKRIVNLNIINEGRVDLLVKGAAYVLGYNSTTMLEAIVAGKPIITPFFGDLIRDVDWDYFQKFPELVHYVRSYHGLEELILSGKDQPHPSYERKREFLEPMIYRIDGNASLRAEQEIIDLIELSRGFYIENDKNKNQL